MPRTEAMDRFENRVQIPTASLLNIEGFQEVDYQRRWATTLYLESHNGMLPNSADAILNVV